MDFFRLFLNAIIAIVTVGMVYLNYLFNFISMWLLGGLLFFIGISLLLYFLTKINSDKLKESEHESNRPLTVNEAKIAINNHLLNESNFNKSINWEKRQSYHARTKTFHWNGRDSRYYGVIAELFEDSETPMGDMVRIIWSLDTNEEIALDGLEFNYTQTDPFRDFTPAVIVGNYQSRKDKYSGTQIFMGKDSDAFSAIEKKRDEDGIEDKENS